MGACTSLHGPAREPDSIREFECAYAPTGETLGIGTFGHVSSVVSSKSGRRRAVKIISFEDSDGCLNTKQRWYALREEKLLRKVRGHRCVVNLLKSYVDEGKFTVMLVMEQCSTPLLKCMPYLLEAASEAEICELLRDLLLGVQHVHSRRIVHRDIKLDNLLLAGKEDGTLKLSDFGLAEFLPSCLKLHGCYGTVPYMSPEMVSRVGHSFSTDIWSIGVTAYALVFGNFPFSSRSKERNALKLVIVSGIPAPEFATASSHFCERSPSAKDFVQKLLIRDPDARPTARQMLSHPLLAMRRNRACQAWACMTQNQKLPGPADELVMRSNAFLQNKLTEVRGGSINF
eukprot:TRINITY_DN7519_c0_g1_i10.p1 TRINITY_DN7519_c0_g1~~TRINITY_DN7519_c0_g1_i10.p1  ORF type:complete len:344 (-),score=57.28 TRINITY_DN7519_c0_g1_i10:38-1069(-)